MDIISHGLWGGATFGRKSRKHFWWAFFIGTAPDLFSFGIYTFASLFNIGDQTRGQEFGQHNMSDIPAYVGSLYNVTHSLVIFLLVFGLIWFIRKKPLWLLGAWGFHILVDIPTHARSFFPTPFLWPVANFYVDGVNWENPIIFFPNLALLAFVYGAWFIIWKRNKQKSQQV